MPKRSKRRVTLVDIGRSAGVSRSTVSLVLRESPVVAEETRRRVRAAMGHLGYVYNRGAAVLRSRRSHIVGLVLTDITNPFYSAFASGVSEVLRQNGWVLLLADSSETRAVQTDIINRLAEHNVDGLIVCPAEHTREADLEGIVAGQIPCVLAMRHLDGLSIDYVGPNYERGMHLAIDHLADAGHRRVAFVGHVGDTSSAADRFRGCTRAAANNGVHVEHVDCPVTRDGGKRAAADLVDRPEVTGCVCYSDRVAFGVMTGLTNLGIRVGRDFAVVGMDNLPESESSVPPLTTVSVQSRAIGRRAGDLIIRRIKGPTEVAEMVIIEPELVIRESTCPPRTLALVAAALPV